MRRLVAVSLVVVLSFFCISPAFASNSIRVFYAGDSGSNVRTALGLAPAGTFTFVNDPAQADVFFLNGDIPQSDAMIQRLNEGAGLVLIFGENTTQDQVSAVLGIPLQLTPHSEAISITGLKGIEDPLLSEIVWNGAPQ